LASERRIRGWYCGLLLAGATPGVKFVTIHRFGGIANQLLHPGCGSERLIPRLNGFPTWPRSMDESKPGVGRDDGANGPLLGDADLSQAGSIDSLPSSLANDPVDTARAFYQCRGFRSLDLRDVAATDALIKAGLRRKRRVKLRRLMRPMAIFILLCLAGCAAWMWR
jgi:hypothetical protein